MLKPLVSVICITYNHVQFIRSCIESLIAQKCDFSYEIIIYDDASTDGTIDIIKEYYQKYPNLIKPILRKENQWSKTPGVIDVLFNNPQANGKYIAICEADDFWISKDKLQKQVSILEHNAECFITGGAYLMIKDGKEKIIRQCKWITDNYNDGEGRVFELEDLKNNFFIKSSTILFRNQPEILNRLKKYEYCLDIHLIYLCLLSGKGYYFLDVLAGYNRHKSGVFSSKSSRQLILIHYFILKDIYEKDRNEFIREQYLKLCYQIINLKVSNFMSTKKITVTELNDKEINIKILYKDIKALIRTKDEKNEFYKSIIPLQVKLIQQKAKSLLSYLS